MVVAVLLGVGEVVMIWITLFPLANEQAWEAFRRLTDGSQPQPKRGIGGWALLALAGLVLPGVAVLAVWRFAVGAPVRTWQPGSLIPLWIATLIVAMGFGNLGATFLAAPSVLPWFRVLGAIDVGLAAAAVLSALALSIRYATTRRRAPVDASPTASGE